MKSLLANIKLNKVMFVLGLVVILVTSLLLMRPAQTANEYTCGIEEHVHTEDCYELINACEANELGEYSGETDDESCIKKLLVCEKTEHVHTEDCYFVEPVSEDAQYVIDLINKLPTVDDYNHTILTMESLSATEEEINNYKEDILEQLQIAYTNYNDLLNDEQKEVTNYAKLNEFIENEILVLVKNKDVGTYDIPSTIDNDLHIIQGANTSSFININLYNYGSTAPKHANLKYTSSNYILPGFQLPVGTWDVTTLNSNSFNFGDLITVDTGVNNVTTNKLRGPINSITNAANSPLNGVMKQTLVNGYPALASGESLSYLFSNNDYAKQVNTTSIDGLFIYDQKTGTYSYDSRHNHAQYDSTTNSFKLYDEMITPNYTMYPFGNFLPFNNIETQAVQVNQFNHEYLLEIINTCKEKYANGYGDKYEDLANVLTDFDKAMVKATNKTNWTASDALTQYFRKAGLIGSSNSMTVDDNTNLYTIDFDEPKDFFFGFTMSMSFMQPYEGKTGIDGNQTMKFHFSGDDDVWVYIDEVLFLDLSGIHRHVGGDIDFEKGEVHYYSLDSSTGDISTTPYKTVTFREVLTAAGKTNNQINEILNDNGTFKNYTFHEMDFYYMERGSGSSVMKLNFNMPLVNRNSLMISKTVEVSDEIQLLGNPDFLFQIMKVNEDEGKEDEVYVFSGMTYDIYTSSGIKINDEPISIKEDGIISLKAGQHAVIGSIPETIGEYYVRELLAENWAEQYESIIIDGVDILVDKTAPMITVGKNNYIIVKDHRAIGAKNERYLFENVVDVDKTSKLVIKKTIDSENLNLTESQLNKLKNKEFKFYVTIDDEALPVGTEYTVGKETRIVETKGIIVIKPDEEAVISDILATAEFKVQEKNSSSGYKVTYKVNDEIVDGDMATGEIPVNTRVVVEIMNQEQGEYLTIPIRKSTTNPDGINYTYTYNLVNVLDNGTELEETKTITVDEDGKGSTTFKVWYSQPDMDLGTTIYKYRIYELKKTTYNNSTVDNDRYTRYDTSVYNIEVTVKNAEGKRLDISYKITKEGKEVDDITFVNERLASLTLRKIVDSKDPNAEGKFTFNLESKDVKDGTYETSLGTFVEFKDGMATVQLGHQDVLTIYGLPYAATFNIKEESTEGFAVIYTINGKEEIEGDFAEGVTLATKQVSVNENPFGVSYDTDVSFTNMRGYELPETGSPIVVIAVIVGCLMVITSIIYTLKAIENKKKSSQI